MSISRSSSDLVPVLLREGDGRQLVVLLHEVLVRQEVEGTLLVGLDRILASEIFEELTPNAR